MLAGLWTCTDLSAREAFRSRLGLLLALYAATLLLAVPVTSDVLPAGRVEAAAGVLHAVTSVFGALAVLAHAARGIPLDIRNRFLATVLVKPVPGSSYFLGRLLGSLLVATFFSATALVAGGAILLVAGRAWGERVTVETISGKPASIVKEDDRARILWDDAPLRDRDAAVRIVLVNNPYDTPALDLVWQRGSGGPIAASSACLVAGKRILDLPVPDALAAGNAPLELVISGAGGGSFPGPAAWAASPALIVRGSREFRLWTGHVVVLWGTLAFAAAAAVFLSAFCSWPLAFAAAAVLLLAGHSHAFLKLLPQALDPKALSGVFSPTIYHSHGHDHGHDHSGHGHAEKKSMVPVLQRFATAAVPALLVAIPDLTSLESADRLAEGKLTSGSEIISFIVMVLARMVPLMILGAWIMPRKAIT